MYKDIFSMSKNINIDTTIQWIIGNYYVLIVVVGIALLGLMSWSLGLSQKCPYLDDDFKADKHDTDSLTDTLPSGRFFISE